MFEGMTSEEKMSLLLELPSMALVDQDAILEKVEELMLRAFRDGVCAGRG